MSTTVEVLADAVRDAGTPFIVGHPGGESAELMQAARERGMRLAAPFRRLFVPARPTVIAARIDPSGYVAQFNALREL